MEIREQLKSVIGTSDKLNDKDLRTLSLLVSIEDNEVEELAFAKALENNVNNFSFNEKLFADLINKIEDVVVLNFLKYTMFCYFERLSNNFKRYCYDDRNKSSCQNADTIISVWKFDKESFDLSKELKRKAEHTAEYLAVYVHRTLQQTIMRVFMNYIYVSDDADLMEISKLSYEGMGYI